MPALVVHCKKAKFDVYIGRPSKWGNPFPVPSKGYDRVKDPARILARYEEYVLSKPDLVAALPELRGKVLACWCAPQRCHGDILARLANGPDRDGFRYCEFCGCHTNARLRCCCDKGQTADREASALRLREAQRR